MSSERVRGGELLYLGEYRRAVQVLTKAIELEPDDADIYINRGAAYAALAEYESAIADYNKAIELDPDNATAYNNRGLAYASQGNYELALRFQQGASGGGCQEK